jgi:hypothetical protein
MHTTALFFDCLATGWQFFGLVPNLSHRPTKAIDRLTYQRRSNLKSYRGRALDLLITMVTRLVQVAQDFS